MVKLVKELKVQQAMVAAKKGQVKLGGHGSQVWGGAGIAHLRLARGQKFDIDDTDLQRLEFFDSFWSVC